MAESAATRITKLTSPAAMGMCVRRITVTKGDSAVPEAIIVQGTMARINASVKI